MEPVCTEANAFFGAKGWHKSQLWVRPGGCCRTIDVFIYWLTSLSSRSFTITKRPSLLVCVNRLLEEGERGSLGIKIYQNSVSRNMSLCWGVGRDYTNPHSHTQRPSVSVRLKITAFWILVCVRCQNVPRVNSIAGQLHAVRATNINSLCAEAASIRAEGCLVGSVTPELSGIRLPQWPQLFETARIGHEAEECFVITGRFLPI